MSNLVLYTISHCPHCNEALELLNNYAADTGIDYEVVEASVEIHKTDDAMMVKKAFVIYNSDKSESYELPAAPCLWIRDRNELIVGVGAIDYLKRLNGDL